MLQRGESECFVPMGNIRNTTISSDVIDPILIDINRRIPRADGSGRRHKPTISIYCMLVA
jgi:hypothetical protein